MCLMSDAFPTTLMQCTELGEYIGRHYIQLHVDSGHCYGYYKCNVEILPTETVCSVWVITLARKFGTGDDEEEEKGDWSEEVIIHSESRIDLVGPELYLDSDSNSDNKLDVILSEAVSTVQVRDAGESETIKDKKSGNLLSLSAIDL